MAKIPVGRTIGYAYRFTFGHFLTLLGLVWLPFVVMMLSAYLLLRPLLGATRIAMALNDPRALLASLPLMLIVVSIAFTCFTMMSVSLTREALGLRRGLAFVSFPLDATLWRLLVAHLLVVLILVGVLLGGFAVVVVVALLINALFGAIHAGVIAGASLVMTAVLFIYVMIRLAFFLVPATVAEQHRSIRRAWQLSQDNFWRIILVVTAMIGPFVVLQLILEPLFALPLSPPPPGSSPAEISAFLSRSEEQLFSRWPLLSAFALLVLTLQVCLSAGAAAFAYRAQVKAEATRPRPAAV
jgi:hypothetical protein